MGGGQFRRQPVSSSVAARSLDAIYGDPKECPPSGAQKWGLYAMAEQP